MSGAGDLLLLVAVLTPVAGLALGLVRAMRPALAGLLPLAPLPALLAAVVALAGGPLAVDLPLLRLVLRLDTVGALLLCPAALLWSAAGLWALGWLGRTASGLRFTVCWLLTLTGSLGIFAVADLPGFYLFFALVSLPAYGLVAHDDSDAHDDDGGAPLKHSHADQVHAAPFVTVAAPVLLLPDFDVAVASPPASLPVQQHPYPPFRPPQNVLSA